MHTVGEEFPPGKRLVFPGGTLTVRYLPRHLRWIRIGLFSGNHENGCAWPDGVYRGNGDFSPPNPSEAKKGPLDPNLDPPYSTERATIGSHCREPLATFKPILSYGAPPPKTRASIRLDAWRVEFSP
jgi:hypothetical protein